VVIQTDRGEFHPNSLFGVTPPYNSICVYSGQLGRSAKDHVNLSTDGEHFFRPEAKPRVAHVFNLHDVGGLPCRQDDRQRCGEPWTTLPFLYD